MEERAIELYNEGYWYYHGENDYPLNYELAFARFSEASQLSCGPAMNYLGTMYEDGMGTVPDIATAFYWYSMAAQAGDAYGNYHLGRLYYNGIYVNQDYQKAMMYFEKSYSIEKNTFAAFYLGCDYLQKGDYSTAMPLFQYVTDETDSPEAWYNLGLCFMRKQAAENGNYALYAGFAADYFLKAANLGYPPAMLQYAHILTSIDHESGVKRAYPWVKKAVDLGYEPAKKTLKWYNAYNIIDRFT